MAINAALLNPNGLIFDAAGNLIFDDQNNNRVRKINMTTGIITTVAGDGGANYNKPDGTAAVNYSFKNLTDIYVDGQGNILLADENNLKIQEMDAVTGIISTRAGTGYLGFGADCVDPKTVPFGDCAGVVKDLAGNIYFTDLTFHRIRKIIKGGNLIPKVQIAADRNNVCAGSAINFSASVQDGGPTPVYQWTVNGVDAGSNSPVFTSSSLPNNAIVVCKLTSSAVSVCTSVKTGISNAVTIVIKPVIKPAITVAATANIICTGTPVTFSATTNDIGTNAEFQWSINGLPAGNNQNSLTSSSLVNNDVVSCLLIADPNQNCLLNDSAVSNTIIMQVSAAVSPTVTINSSGNLICPNDGVKFTASGQNAGSNPSYQWIINGLQTGINSAVYENTNFKNGDNIYCVLTASNTGCPSTIPVVSNTETILVKPAPVINLGVSDTTILPLQQIQLKASFSGDLASFSWSPASKLVNGTDPEPMTLPLTGTTVFQINAIGVNGCSATKQVTVYVFYDKLYIPSAFTPNGDGLNDFFRIPDKVAITLKEFSIFDRWGKKIFTTKDRMKGWDGMNNGKPANTGVYIYMISGSTPDGNVLSKGIITLIR